MEKKRGGGDEIPPVTMDACASGWFRCRVGLWHTTIYLFVGEWSDMLRTGRVRFKDRPDMLEGIAEFATGTDAANVWFVDKTNAIIRMQKFRPCWLDDQLSLSHECLHAAQHILHNVHAEVDPAGSETLAYTHEFIVGKLTHEILKKMGRKKSK